MRKLILPLLCLILLAWVSSIGARMSVMIVGGGAPDAPVAPDYTDIELWDRAESQNQGVGDYPGTATWAGDNLFSAGGRTNNGFIIADTGDGNDKGYIDWNEATLSGTEGTIYIEIYIDTWANDAELFRLYDNGSDYITVQLASDDGIILYWKEGGSGKSGVEDYACTNGGDTFAAGAWYLIEVNYKASTNYRKLAVYKTDGTEVCSVTDSITVISGFIIDSGYLYYGNNQTEADFDVKLDNFRISSSSTRDFVALRSTDASPR